MGVRGVGSAARNSVGSTWTLRRVDGPRGRETNIHASAAGPRRDSTNPRIVLEVTTVIASGAGDGGCGGFCDFGAEYSAVVDSMYPIFFYSVNKYFVGNPFG